MVSRVTLLGATGSIGLSTLEVIADHPGRFRVVALVSGRQAGKLVELARRFRPEVVALADPSGAREVAAALADEPIRVLSGPEGVAAAAAWASGDIVVSAMVGAAGLLPTLAAIRAGKTIALANKECLVTAGALFLAEVKRHGVALIPVDSEHSAIFQVLQQRQAVRRLTLTASGGPFRGLSLDELALVTPERALAHPNWRMGPKITVDSATLMNKGLEVIEARWLFDVPPERIGVVVHPESIVHSLVEYVDGSTLAQLGMPDMRTPIAVALAWPERIATRVPALNLAEVGRLTFLPPPDGELFPCLPLAYEVLSRNDGSAAVLNAANEVAVAAFLSGRIGFLEIPRLITWALGAIAAPLPGHIDDVLALDELTRARVTERVASLG